MFKVHDDVQLMKNVSDKMKMSIAEDIMVGENPFIIDTTSGFQLKVEKLVIFIIFNFFKAFVFTLTRGLQGRAAVRDPLLFEMKNKTIVTKIKPFYCEKSYKDIK